VFLIKDKGAPAQVPVEWLSDAQSGGELIKVKVKADRSWR
jgi:hypothetical protein